MAVKHQFYEIAHFPGVIALTDGTHIPIIKPVEGEAEVYINWKGFYSLNVQLTCGPDMQIYNVVARWPGSTHDNRILENSSLHHRLSTNQLRGIILADGGYGNKR
jgi:nuclease HARBI1